MTLSAYSVLSLLIIIVADLEFGSISNRGTIFYRTEYWMRRFFLMEEDDGHPIKNQDGLNIILCNLFSTEYDACI